VTLSSIEDFENALAGMMHQPDAIAFAYARHALSLIVRGLGLVADDEVVLSPLTCRVVPLALQSVGVRPLFADISADHLNLDPADIERVWSPRTRAILFQHTYGTSDGIADVAAFSRSRGVPLIEDCAQCLPGADVSDGPGTSGIASFWSNNLRKPLPAAAGGFALTSSPELVGYLRRRRDEGRARSAPEELTLRIEAWGHRHLVRPRSYWFLYGLSHRLRGSTRARTLESAIRAEIASVPVRLSSRQVAWGLAALATVSRRIEHRRRLTGLYHDAIVGLQHVRAMPTSPKSCLYYAPILIEDKARMLDTARHHRRELIAWPISLPIFPIENREELAHCGYREGSCPNAERIARSLCGLPLDIDTETGDVLAMVDLLRRHEPTPRGVRPTHA
jgi:dTDP-4-amino-4,6-dideoxygalactose transaminase